MYSYLRDNLEYESRLCFEVQRLNQFQLASAQVLQVRLKSRAQLEELSRLLRVKSAGDSSVQTWVDPNEERFDDLARRGVLRNENHSRSSET